MDIKSLNRVKKKINNIQKEIQEIEEIVNNISLSNKSKIKSKKYKNKKKDVYYIYENEYGCTVFLIKDRNNRDIINHNKTIKTINEHFESFKEEKEKLNEIEENNNSEIIKEKSKEIMKKKVNKINSGSNKQNYKYKMERCIKLYKLFEKMCENYNLDKEDINLLEFSISNISRMSKKNWDKWFSFLEKDIIINEIANNKVKNNNAEFKNKEKI
jgi:hypothetical protein